MKQRFLLALLFGVFLFCNQNVFSQLTVVQNNSAQQLGDNIAGSNIAVTNATASGAPNQFGTFNFNGPELGVNSGVILSSGNVLDAIGPNSDGSMSTAFNGPGDPDLSALCGETTHDAAILEFDFQVEGDEVEFNFIFMSEEYNEWVGSQFNDVFAFYISGPGIGTQNLAVVPGTQQPITINNINMGSNPQYYVNNEFGPIDIEFDGFTTPLTASKSGLIPCQTYTLSLRVADASDGILDAAILFEENSLVQPNLSASSYTYSADTTALEGCYDASFTFTLDTISNQDVVIPLTFGGTAINGVDYALVDSYVVIPAGQTSGTIIIDAFLDGLTEGQETVQLLFESSPCGPMDSVYLFIDDYDPIEYTINPTDVTCNGYQNGELDINISGGFAPYLVTLTDSLTGTVTSHNTFPITSLDAGTYFVEIIDAYGCSAEEIISGNYLDTQVSPIPDNKDGVYTSTLPISGFAPGETIQSADQIQSICMTLEHSRLSDLQIMLTAPDGTEIHLKEPLGGGVTNLGEPCAVAPNDIGNSVTDPGIGYNYCWQNNALYGTMVSESSTHWYWYTNTCDGSIQQDDHLPSSSYLPYDPFSQFIGVPMNGNWMITIDDWVPINDGFIFDWSLTLQSNIVDTLFMINEPALPQISEVVTTPDCGQSTGAIDLTVSTGLAPFTFLWNSGATTEDLTGIPAGIYTVDITDASNCVYTHQVNVPNTGSLSVTGLVTNESCFQSADGAIDISVSGGVNPISYTWSSGQTMEDLQNVSPGTYTVTVEDGNGCLAIETYTINDAPQINISAVVTNEHCADGEGTIDVTVIGAIQPVMYYWNGIVGSEDIDNLSTGTYNFSLVDSNNCTASASYGIINLIGDCLPDCDLEVSGVLIQNDACGQGVGEIELIVSTTSGPVQIDWSNGATTSTISNLLPGNYDVTITDALGCELIETYTVGNESGTFSIDSLVATPSGCLASNGTVTSYISGGTQPYSYTWSNGATTPNLSGVGAGTYQLTVTDDNNCSVIENVDVVNWWSSLEITSVLTDDPDCGSSNGWIDINVVGGTPPYSANWNFPTNSSLSQLNLGPGNYQCTISDMNGCQISSPVITLTNVSPTISIVDLNVDHEICFDGQGEIEIVVAGGPTPLVYMWNTGASTSSISGLSAGTYDCTVTDGNGCTINTGPIEILNESGSLAVDNLTVVDEVCGNGSGSINLTITGGNAPISYQWSNFSTSEDLYNLSAGTYSCTITDNAGCEVYANGGVMNTAGDLAIDNYITANDSCGAGSIDLIFSGGTAPISFLWNTGATTEDLSGLNNGNYSVTITDDNGCTISGSTNLNVGISGLVVDDAVVNNQQCGNGAGLIDLTVSGGTQPYTFTWSNGATTQDIFNLSSGTYSCLITDADGCLIQTEDYIINNGAGGMSVVSLTVTDDLCSGGTGALDLEVTGGTAPYSYLWSNSNTTEDLTGITGGFYSVTITDDNGCEITTDATVLNDPGTLSIDNVSITDEVCGNSNGAIDIDVSGGTTTYSYVWSNADITEDITGIGTGTYSVTVTDAAGCLIFLDNLIVGDSPGQLSIDAINVTDENCSDGQGYIDLIVSGNVGATNYMWSNGETTEDIGNLSAGTYSGTVIDANGCSATFSATVQNGPGGISIFGTPTHLCGDALNNGSLDIWVNGASGNVDYTWSNGATAEDLDNLTAGTYTLTVTDDSLCTTTESFTINPNAVEPEILEIVQEPASCAFCEDGSIYIFAHANSEECTFLWSNGATTPSIYDLNPGYYIVQITSPDGCTITQTFYVDNSDPYKDVTECNFDVYPNPSNGMFEVSYIQWDADTVHLNVYDARGRAVHHQAAEVVGTSGTISMDLRNLAPGMYFLRLNPECEKVMYRIVIN